MVKVLWFHNSGHIAGVKRTQTSTMMETSKDKMDKSEEKQEADYDQKEKLGELSLPSLKFGLEVFVKIC